MNNYKLDFKHVRKGFLVSKEYELKQEPIKGQKAKKVYNKETLVVDINGKPLEADSLSLVYMNSVMVLAISKWIELVSTGTSLADAMDEVMNTVIKWKGADNKIHEIPIANIRDAIENTLLELSKIIGIK